MYLRLQEVCSPVNYTCVQYAETWRGHDSFRRETAGYGKFNHGGKIGAISERTAGMRTGESAAGAQRDMKSKQLMLKHIKEPPPTHTHTEKSGIIIRDVLWRQRCDRLTHFTAFSGAQIANGSGPRRHHATPAEPRANL